MPDTDAQANGVDWACWMGALGGRVLRAREFLGFSQDQLARVAGVSQGAVSRLENGRGLATPLLVVTKISAALHTAHGTFLSAVTPPDQPLDELLRLYRSLSEGQRRHLLAVVRAITAALSDEPAGDARGG
jgi:transcriptional regulator with XRE-family HTH domain